MTNPTQQLPTMPTHEDLALRLNTMFADSGITDGPVEVVARSPHRNMSLFPIEVVSCRLSNGTLRHLLLKYQSGKSHSKYGHRGDIDYEAEVYRRILALREGFRPKFYGTCAGVEPGDTWLVLEYLDQGNQVRRIGVHEEQHAAMALAARWIARFHAEFEAPAARASFGFLRRYDEHFYAGWVRRTREFSSGLHSKFPWLPLLCERAEELLAPLWTVAPTVIHGEFYTNNILLCDGKIHVVDWETAAVGPDLIDLAALTEGNWLSTAVLNCKREYVESRWGQEAPPHFEPLLEGARIYLHFRSLGDRLDKTVSEKRSWRFERLRLIAGRLGLVGAGE